MAYVWHNPEGTVRVRLDGETADGIRAQSIDAFVSLPRRGAETGGLLLGEIENESPLRVRIEGFEAVPCEYRFGPSYVLSQTDREKLEHALEAHADRGSSVVGLYRSYTGRDPELDAADRELAKAYFSGRVAVFLLLRPLAADKSVATFACAQNGELRGPWPPQPFPFTEAPVAMPEAPPERRAEPVPELAPEPFPAPVRAPRVEVERVLGDILEEPPPPPRVRAPLPPPARPRRYAGEETVPSGRKPRFWVPLFAVIALSTGAAFVYEWWNLGGRAAPVRPAAPRAQSADRVAAGPVAPPATPPPAVTPTPAPAVKPPPAEPAPRPARARAPRPRPARSGAVAVGPVPVHKVQPGISEAIRSRIAGKLVVPVEVRVSESGRVISAVPGKGKDDAVYRYLSTRAATAARLWRFQPARTRTGAPVAAEKTLYFVFTR